MLKWIISAATLGLAAIAAYVLHLQHDKHYPSLQVVGAAPPETICNTVEEAQAAWLASFDETDQLPLKLGQVRYVSLGDKGMWECIIMGLQANSVSVMVRMFPEPDKTIWYLFPHAPGALIPVKWDDIGTLVHESDTIPEEIETPVLV